MTDRKSKVSVIVPVYNVENYLKRCVDSLTQQSLADIEILLIDDGSTDRSGELCDELAKTDVRISVYHKKNEGQGIARNSGLQKATGKYVVFLDSDDYYDPDTCRDLFELMEHTQADLCCYGYQIETQDRQVVRIPNITDREYEGEAFLKEFVPHYFGDQPEKDDLRGFSSCMSIFRREIIEEHNICFPSEREYLSEDTIFSLRFCEHANKAVTTSKIYYHYCQNPNSFSQAFHKERLNQTISFGKTLDEWAVRMEIEPETNVRRAMYLWVNLMAYLRQGIRYYEQTDRRQEIPFVKDVCRQTEVEKKLGQLREVQLPRQQKLLLWMILGKHYRSVLLLVRVRAKVKL